jgi:hypothetical protein
VTSVLSCRRSPPPSPQGSKAAAAVVQSLLADEFGLPVPPWPMEREDADAHA